MISIQQQDFSVADEYFALSQNAHAGAIVFFVGLVRDMNQSEQVSELFLEHYPSMTQRVLETLADDANNRWDLDAVRIIHRVGHLTANEQIVFVGVSSAHRGDAFSAAEYIMDTLKTQAPFWKKETREGQSHWLDARASDTQAANRWLKSQ